MPAAHIVVEGEVQGVGFRYFIRQHALRLLLNGFVRNLVDGNVEIEVEGEQSAIEQLLVLAKAGPRLGRVENVTVLWKESTGLYSFFGIR
ncbi:MAG: acylphosphatase [Terriglobia bacterium]